MGWKLFALISLVLSIGGFRDILSGEAPITIVEAIGFPISTIANLGLFIFAFKMPAGSPQIWQVFSVVFVIWSAVAIGTMILRGQQAPEGSPSLIAMAIAILMVACVSFFNWLALHRLSKASLL